MATGQIPARMKAILVQTQSSNFREATKIVEVDVPKPGPKQVLVKHKYVGINAVDIYYTAGGDCPDIPPTEGAGLEAIGEIVDTGPEASMKVGQTVVFLNLGSCYREYSSVDEASCFIVPSADPAFLSLAISGVTASLALEQKGDLKKGETVLITAASGGTGQFAVQLAKAAGCHVIGTCSSSKKAEVLKSLGCDRAINYNEENLAEVIPKEYPNGIDVVYESVGGETYEICLTNLAPKGRLIVIGQISSYEEQESKVVVSQGLLFKCIDIKGFGLQYYIDAIPSHVQMLAQQYLEGKLKILTDCGPEEKPFKGVEAIYDAVEYMFRKKNIGKLVVALDA